MQHSKFKTLRLVNNKIDNVSREIFNGLSGLQRLDLGGNRLSIIPDDAFADLSRLLYLELHKINSHSSVIMNSRKIVTAIRKLSRFTINEQIAIKQFSF